MLNQVFCTECGAEIISTGKLEGISQSSYDSITGEKREERLYRCRGWFHDRARVITVGGRIVNSYITIDWGL